MSSDSSLFVDKTQFDITNDLIKRLKEQSWGLAVLRLFFSSLSFVFKAADKAVYPYIMPVAAFIGIIWFYLNLLEAKTTRNININLWGKLASNSALAILGIVGCVLFFAFGIGSITLISAATAAFYGVKFLVKTGLSLTYAVRYFYCEPGTKRKQECEERAIRYAKSGLSSLLSSIVAVVITALSVVGGPLGWGLLSLAFIAKMVANGDTILADLLKEKSPIKEMTNEVEHIEDKLLKKTLASNLIVKQIKILELEERYLGQLRDKVKHSANYTFVKMNSGSAEIQDDKLYVEFENDKLFYKTKRSGKYQHEITANYFHHEDIYKALCKEIKEHQNQDKDWLYLLEKHKNSILNMTAKKEHTRFEPLTIRMISWAKLVFYSFFTQQQKEEIKFLKKFQKEWETSISPYPDSLSKKGETYLVYQCVENVNNLLQNDVGCNLEKNKNKPMRCTDTIIGTMSMIEDRELRKQFLISMIDNKIVALRDSRSNIYKKEKITFLNQVKEALTEKDTNFSSDSSPVKMLKSLIETEGAEGTAGTKTLTKNNADTASALTKLVPADLTDDLKKNLQKVFFSAKKQISETELLYRAALFHVYYKTAHLHKPGAKRGKFYYKDIIETLKQIKDADQQKSYLIALLKEKISDLGSNPKGKIKNKKIALKWCLKWLEGNREPCTFSITEKKSEYTYQCSGIEEWMKIIHKKHRKFKADVFTSYWEGIGETDGLLRAVAEYDKLHPQSLKLLINEPNDSHSCSPSNYADIHPSISTTSLIAS